MNDRRLDLDWLRIGAFAVLILYHVGMFYVTWGWHVKSSYASPAIEPLMQIVNPWRLTLLFLISGAATRFMADKMKPGPLLASRMGRLWPPLILAVFVIVPPQTYYEVYEGLQRAGEADPGASPVLADFYQRYVSASGGWCSADGCITTPTYNHMWFVAYLILYTLALIALLPLLRRIPRAVSVLIAGPGLILTPWLFLWLARATLFPIFGETHDFRADWYLHTVYFATFLFGFATAKHEPFFERAARMRWPALAAALAAWACVQVYYAAYGDSTPPEWLRTIFRGVRELQAWCFILAALGFAYRHLRNADAPIREVLTQAIFPAYLVHQTVIVVAGHYLDAAALPVWVEAPLLIGATLLGCALFYLLARAVPPLRVWAGLASKPKQKHASGLAGQTGEAR
ncbi:MAG: acyltransferase [Hyphomonadaceae bacterium]|nr:acyltransferase [Hyphomonadaceae bacterium]